MRFTGFRQRRPNRRDLTVEAPNKAAIDHLGAVDAGDPEVSALLDADPCVVGNEWDAS